MRKLFALLTLLCGGASLWAQASNTQTPDSSLATTLFAKAESLFETQPDSAMKYYQAVLPLAEAEASWDLYVTSCCILYRILHNRQAYEKLENYAQKAFSIAIKHLNPRETIFIAATNNLGTYYYSKGDYEMAVSIMRQTIELLEAQDDPNPIHLAKCYSNLGRYHQKRGDFSECLHYYKTALRIKMQHESTYSGLSLAVGQHLIGRTYMKYHQEDSALQYFHAASALLNQSSQAQYQRKKLDVSLSLVDAFLHLKQLDSVGYYSQQCQALQDFATPLQNARFHGLQSRQASLQDMPQLALKHLEDAKVLYEQQYSFQQAEITKILRQIGQIHQKMGKVEKAILSFEQGLDILKRTSGSHALSSPYRHPIEAYSLIMALGEAYEENQEAEKALQYYQQAVDLMQFIRSGFYNLEAKYFWSEGRFASVFSRIVRLCEQEYSLSQETQYFEQAFAAAEANKAFVLYESQHKQLARIQTQLPDSVWKEGQKIEREIQFYQQKLWTAEARGKGNIDSYQAKLFSWQQRRDQWQANVQSNFPDYYQQTLAPIQLLSLDSLQQQLTDSTLLLEYFRSKTAYYVFSLSQDAVSFQRLEANSKAIESQIDRFYEQLYMSEPNLDAFATFSQLSSELYQQLLGPYLEEARFAELIVIADGQIAYLPFELLSSQAPSQTAQSSVRQWREYPYLLHKYAIQYAYSASLLFAPRQLAPQYEAQWLGVAPKYEANLALNHNQTEVKALAQKLKGDLLVGEEAKKADFIAQAADYQILHLAMHGFADAEDPMHAHLAFKQGAEHALFAWEIPYLPLHTDLVVLSACESGYGKFQAGEGVMSLARAFSLAGCKSVVNTLWTINDVTSQRINELFYAQLLAGDNKAEALRKAKLAYIAKAPPHALHPHYWAAFVLTGSAEPLLIQTSSWQLGAAGILLLLALIGFVWRFIRRSRLL